MSARGLLPERVFQGVILAINPDGTLKWESHHGFNPTALSIGGDGTIYFGLGSGTPTGVCALNPDGSLKWQFDEPQGGFVRTPPGIGRGRVYAGSADGIFAIGP